MNKYIISALALLLCGALYAADNTATIQLRVTAVTGGKTDVLNLFENESYSEAFVQGEDSKKMSYTDASKVFVYTIVDSEVCANKGTNNLYGTEIIVKTNSSAKYKFTVPYVAGSKQYYLFDAEMFKLTKIESTALYEFDAPATQAVTGRFYLLDLSEHPRSVAQDNWGTICFTYAIGEIEGASLYEFAGINTAKTTVYADPVELKDIVAGKAYLFKATGDAGQVFKYAAMGPVDAPITNNGLVGTFEDSTTVAQSWFVKGEQIIPAAATSTVPQYRAFIPSLDDILPVGDQAGAPGRLMFGVKGNPSGLEDVNENRISDVHKFVNNGQLILIRDGKKYNAQGAQL